MSLRTKLILAFLLLSVAPLSALVVYSYVSSTAAARRVAFEESTALADEMGQRMSLVKNDLARRVRQLGRLPLGALAEGGVEGEERSALLRQVEVAIGEVAPFVEAIEFVPQVPEAPVAPRPAVRPAPAAAPEALAKTLGPIVIRLDSLAAAGRRQEAESRQAELSALQELIAAHTSEAVHLARERAGDARRAAVAAVPPAPEAPPAAMTLGVALALPWMESASRLAPEARRALDAKAEETKKLLGRDFDCPVEQHGKKIGSFEARVSAKQLLQGVLALSRRDRGEIPFALDSDGAVYTADPEDAAILKTLPLAAGGGEEEREPGDWVLARVKDSESGLVFGIASPLEKSLVELRRTAARNFILGLGLIGFALVGIAPLSRRITRELRDLADGARALAAGNLEARVPVRTRDEVGQLASTFNRMAADLAENQRQLIEQERLAQEREIERLLLATENERKTSELEEARRFQLSLLPKKLPAHPRLDLAVFMRTATEVGGDYYDFRLGEDGAFTLAVGDATGHGARAGTLVTAAKSLFMARAAGTPLASFLAEANRAIKCMDLGRMAMALTVARIDGRRLTLAAAGMPPALVHRAGTGAVEELAAPGLPLGSLADCAYCEVTTELFPGDTVLLMSDGFPELRDAAGEPLGYGRAQAIFAASAAKQPAELIADLAHAVSERKAGALPDDDVTFVAIKVRAV